MKKELKVGIFQMKCSSNQQENKNKIEEKVNKFVNANIDLIVLQELHDNIYFCQTENIDNFELAEKIPGTTSLFYSELAKKNSIVLVASVFEKRARGVYHNTAIVFEKDGSIAGKYRKMHIPEDPGYHEKFYFTPGDIGFEPIKTSVGILGVLICWDQWYPEAARIMALKGADILIYPTAIGFDENDSLEEQRKQINSWKIIQKSHAIANGIPLICVNRCGREISEDSKSKILFWGNSFICGPQGETLYQAEEKEEFSVIKIEMRNSEIVRRNWPFLRDRRIDEYSGIQKRVID